ncbi:hypothetical protein BC938DRAFT_476246, partial [Jimgerdemannia flammicorona]
MTQKWLKPPDRSLNKIFLHLSSKQSTMASTPTRTICVFCGSTDPSSPEYFEQAEELGRAFLANNFALVYGGGTLGLMGVLARTIHEGGGSVTGIIPEPLYEFSGTGFGKVERVKDMHTKKARFNELVRVLSGYIVYDVAD